MGLKIVLLLDSPLIATGYASTCRLTAKELTSRGHEVYGISFNGGAQSDQIIDWYGIKVLPNHALKRNHLAMYGDAETIIQINNDLNPDIFFFHNDSYRYSYITALPQNILDKSIFWLPFEGEAPDPIGVQLFSRCAATRFVTNHALNIHRHELVGKDIGYIPHAIDLEAYYPNIEGRVAAKAAKNLGLENKFMVLRVDRHQPRKYWDLSIKAFAKFAKGKDDVFFLGKCNPKDMTMWNETEQKGINLLAVAEQEGCSKKVFFDDFFFSSPAMAGCFYHPADVFLTTTSGEGFGLTACEAMACGLPVIYPETPVLPEVVAEGGISCKIKKKEWYSPMQVFHNIVDVDDVVAKLEWAYQDWKTNGSTKLNDIGRRGRAIAEKLNSPKAVYDQWDTVFKKTRENKDLVSIVTVLYNITGEAQINGDDGIQNFVTSMESHVKHPYEWIIVDNGSPAKKETREWLEKVSSNNPRIKPLYLETNMGFAGGCNAGIAKSTGNAVILANPDCEALDPQKLNLSADFVSMLLDKARSDNTIGIIGMELNRRDDVLHGSEFPYFCNVLITRACLDACKISEGKWLDESFWPAYYEDLSFTMTAKGKGFKVVAHNVPFWHKSGGTNKFAIEGGNKGPYIKHLEAALEALATNNPAMADFGRKRIELQAGGMQGLIAGNINYLQNKWGIEARQQIKIVWNTHIGASVGFSQIAEGLIPELHEMGFDLYVNDWSNGANVESPLIRQLIEKTKKAKEETDDLESSINIVCWLMETFLDVEAEFKVGTSFCESTKVRPQYLQACNSMDRILTFSDFCRNVQKNSGYTTPITVVPPGVHPIFINYYERPRKDKYTFLAVGVSQDRKDTRRLVEAFCEAFPKDMDYPPECEPGFPLKPSQVELVVKSNNFGELNWIDDLGYSKRANIRKIFTGWDKRAERRDFTMQEMYDLYCEADCLVHSSHGEGIGMPILEGAATGLPVIFTNWSSPAEYLDDSNSYPLSLGPNGTAFSDAYVGNGGAPGENGQWANCHVGHLKHCMRQVIRNPDEAREKGRRAAALIKSKYNWKECARELIPHIFEWEAERKKKVAVNGFDPLTFEKPKLDPIRKGDRVLIDITTRDRHGYLCSLLTSLLGQTFKDWDVIIQVDDNDESMPNDHQIMALNDRMQHEGHRTRIIRSHRQGPHVAHQRSLQMAIDDPNPVKYKLICRIDDDIYLRPDYLENLFALYLKDEKAEIGAISGVYLDPKRSEQDQTAPANFETDLNYAGKIDHNVPWPYICRYPEGTAPRVVEHLYSSFMYRVEVAKAIGGYCKRFSQIGHREESDFSYRFHLAGFKLLIEPKAMGFHYCAPAGGIRSNTIAEKNRLAESDHRIYSRRLDRWKKRAEMRKQRDLQSAIINAPKVAIVINGGSDFKTIQQATERFSAYSKEIYVCCQTQEAKQRLGELKNTLMVATSLDESAVLTKQLLSEGQHEFIMTVTDTMHFDGNPMALLSKHYDDYVFEIYKTYEAESQSIGPECENACLITRKRKDAKPSMDRIFYSDMFVIEDERIKPINGKSVRDQELLQVRQMKQRGWRKICTYQYPEGRLNPARYLDVPASEKLVSIIIPTAGRKSLLKQCIDSIYSHTSTAFEIIIVDNDSQDGTAEYLAAEAKIRPAIRVFRQPYNLGYQKAINIGVSKAHGDHIMLFNDDAWVLGREPDGRDWLQVYIDELKSDPKLGLVGPHAGSSPALGSPLLFFWCVMFQASLWKEVGQLDDVTFRNYGGDDDYAERVRLKGYKIKDRPTNLRHLMNCVPDEVKKPELEESQLKLRAKYNKR